MPGVLRVLAVGTVLVALAVQCEARKAKKIPPWHIRMAKMQGPNACVVEEIPELNKKFWTDCKYWMHRKVCGRNTVVRYECCEGYARIHGRRGCMGVKPLKNVLDTAEDLGAGIFVQYLYESGLGDEILRSGAVTLFAPINTAFEQISAEQKNLLAKSFNNPRSPLLLHHLANGRVYTKDLEAETMVDSKYPDHPLRVNKYSHKMVTVNCVPILRKDQDATNGVVHLIDNLLMPQQSQNVFNAISSDGRFQELSRLMRETGISTKLQGSGSFTVFSPSDEEFTKIPRTRREQIRQYPEAMKELAGAHIIPHTICLPAIINEHKMVTLNGNKITLLCNETGIYVDGSRLIGDSLSGSNGVVHMIGDLIVPERARSVWDLVSQNNLETFSSLAKKTGLESQLENYGEVTLFAFTDEAFKELSEEQQKFYLEDMQATRDLMRFHIVPGRYTKARMVNDQKLMSLDGENFLRFKVYRKGCGVEAAMINRTDIEGLNGVLHIVDKVLLAPKYNIVDLLTQEGNYTIMLEAIRKARISDPGLLNVTRLRSGSITFFAPSDDAFFDLGEERLRLVMENNTYLRQMVKNHIVDHMIASGSFQPQLHYTIQTERNTLEVNKFGPRGLRINTAVVTKPDIVTQEGIVHLVDKVLLPEDSDNHVSYVNNVHYTHHSSSSSSSSSHQGAISSHYSASSSHHTYRHHG